MRYYISIISLFSICNIILAQPAPGDLFREYVWYNETGDCNLDMVLAVKAELVVEKMLCH